MPALSDRPLLYACSPHAQIGEGRGVVADGPVRHGPEVGLYLRPTHVLKQCAIDGVPASCI